MADCILNITTANLQNQKPELAGVPFTLLTADPASPTNGTWWAVYTGSAPTTVAIKARLGGVTYVIASMEF